MRESMNCPSCGTTFIPKDSRVMYCSKKCWRTANKERIRERSKRHYENLKANDPERYAAIQQAQVAKRSAKYWGDDEFRSRMREYCIHKARERQYGLTREEFENMCHAQGDVCAICGQPEVYKQNGVVMRLSVDHDHATGRIRGLLCKSCNNGLGHMRDSQEILKKAIAYLDAAAVCTKAAVETETAG